MARKGRTLETTNLFNAPSGDATLLSHEIDEATFVLADDACEAAERLITRARATHAVLDVTRRSPLAPERSFTLYTFSRPGARPRRMTPAQWQALETTKTQTPLDHGWVCLGCEWTTAADKSRPCTVFLDSSHADDSEVQAVLVAEGNDNRIAVLREKLVARCNFDPSRTVVALRFRIDAQDSVRRGFRVVRPGTSTRELHIPRTPESGWWLLPAP